MKVIILILVLLIILIYFLIIWSPVCIWTSRIDFDTYKFIDRFGKEIVKLDYFINDNKPTLYATKSEEIELRKWLEPYPKGFMTKINLRDKNSYIMNYFDKWIKTQNIPSKLSDRMELEPYTITIRICGDKWHYPNHFDALDNFMIILEGTRICKINGTKVYNLKKGDIFYIPAGTYHEFWIDKSELNVALNINFKRPDMVDKFDKAYPIQTSIQKNSYDFYDPKIFNQ